MKHNIKDLNVHIELDEKGKIEMVWLLYKDAEPIKLPFNRNAELFKELQKDIDDELI
jgi:hypothetical protein